MAEKRSVLDIPIFHKLYDFYKLLHSYHSTVPKMQRYTLWQRCENVALILLEGIIRTSHLQGTARVQLLREVSCNLDLLKVLLRLAQDTRTITSQQYLSLQSLLQEIGKMLGGWLKSVAH